MKSSPSIVLFVVFALSLSGCGAKNVQQAKSDAGYSDESRLKVSCEEAFDTAVKSEYTNSRFAKSSFNYDAGDGEIWYAGSAGVFAVVEFLREQSNECLVKFYQHGGAGYREILTGMKSLLETRFESSGA